MASPTTTISPGLVTSNLLWTGKYSDFTILCQGRKFKVHRAVVCLQSQPIAAAVDGSFKEAILGEVDLDGDEPDVVARMLEFMYTSSYDDGRTIAIPALVDDSAERVSNDGLRYASNNKNKSKKGRQVLESIDSTPLAAIKEDSVDSSLLINAKVYVIADKYDIQPLKQLAETKYKNGLLGHWNSDSFVSSLKLLYEETPDNNRALKDFAMNAAGKHAKALLDRDEFVRLCKENSEIAFEVLKASVPSIVLYNPCPESLDYDHEAGIWNAYKSDWLCPGCLSTFSHKDLQSLDAVKRVSGDLWSSVTNSEGRWDILSAIGIWNGS